MMKLYSFLFFEGNKNLLKYRKIGLLASRNVVPGVSQILIELVNRLSKLNNCVFISGWHSPIEKEIHEDLIKIGKAHIHIGAKSINKMFCQLDKGKTLFISHCDSKVIRITRENALKRNKIICKISDLLLIPWLDTKGKTHNIVSNYCKIIPTFILNKEYNLDLIKHGAYYYNFPKIKSLLEKNNADFNN